MALYQPDTIPQEARVVRRTGRTGVARPRIIDTPSGVKRATIYRMDHPVDSAPTVPTQFLSVNEFHSTRPVHFQELHNAYHVDSYIRQSVDKYAEKVCANGFKLSEVIESDDEFLKTYLVRRLNLMGRAQGYEIPLLSLDVARRLVRDGNVFLVKAWVPSIQVPGVTLKGLPGRGLIGGLFLLEAENMIPVIDQRNGARKGWIYRYRDGMKIQDKLFPLDQIYHFVYCSEGIDGWGYSQNIPALEDVRSLRNAEEAVLRLLYRFLNPLIHVQSPDILGDGQGLQEQVDLAAQILSQMAHDGFVVTGPDYEMKAIGAESQALRAEPYLEFFKQRGFAGLGVSSLIMGEGNYIGNAGANALSVQMHDRAKTYQHIFNQYFTTTILAELLVEAGRDIFSEDGEAAATWTLPEFDDDELRRDQNHKADLFSKGALTRTELREYLKLPPLTTEEEDDTFQAITAKLEAKYQVKVGGVASQAKPKD